MAGDIRYFLNRKGRYYARLVVPKHLRPFLDGKTELRTPLGADRRSAIRKHPMAVASLQQRIGFAERAFSNGRLSEKVRHPLSLEEIVQQEYQRQINFDLEIRQTDDRYAKLGVDIDRAHRLRDGYVGMLTDEELNELVGDRIWRLNVAGHTLAQNGTSEWRSLAQGLCLAIYESLERQHERDEGDFTGSPSHPLLTTKVVKEEPEHAIAFNEIIDEEVKRRARGRDAKPLPERTISKYLSAAAEFVSFRGSDNAATVTAAEGKRWVETMQDSGTLSNRTVKMKLQNVITILNWARQNDPENFLPNGNPLSGVKAPDYSTRPSYLRAYTMDEAKLVLSAARKESKSILRWIPWLCAYSGMRVSEAGQLEKEDFFQVGDRWFWKVTTAGRRSLKTLGSERRIPVHSALMDEGLLEFVEQSASGRLFRGETKEIVSVQQRVGEWVRKLITVEVHPELSPNHGWRHFFEDLCRRDNVPEDARKYMTGRTDGSSQELYGRSDIMLPGLAAAMDQIRPIELLDRSRSTTPRIPEPLNE